MCDELSMVAPPIRGVIHGAMALKDVHIELMTLDDYYMVLNPRYTGTLNLHKHLPESLDFFVMLSSISGIIGNATQSAYAAGSAFMDSFAAYRNSLGLPGVSLDLGVITGIGYLAENKDLAAKMGQRGFQSTNAETLLLLVELAISQSSTDGKCQIVTGLGEWKAGKSIGNFEAPLFAHFRRKFQNYAQLSQAHDNTKVLHDGLKASNTKDEAIGIILEALSERIAIQLNIPVEKVNPGSPISEFGIDSNVAVELRNWIVKTLESTIPILEILASDSIFHLAQQIAARSKLSGAIEEV
ncbi:hypothetical protein N7462_006702 [Penicillium macrosclerotiorum]|uniref:uncharacterized protein n=1 Tax=Penicillium macrosclerotiorum TaxID=303699 RepID=UPI0025467396|nr:uncharacterized protein N7462_006702 [Penicillium macrosclerotiorum]KAJ5683537.1 hypothetical protein N7462_006702 [Penicillium macrosclerotiorum]